MIQERLKLLVAYSTVAQIGYLFLVFPLASNATDRGVLWTGALVFLLAHAAAKSGMFLAAGNIKRAAGHDRIRDLDGITHTRPVSAFTMGLAGVSLDRAAAERRVRRQVAAHRRRPRAGPVVVGRR
jgi:multicomponent Na+:H+ antiporter subunit D